MRYKLLVINPGSTTTKIAIYDDATQVHIRNIDHSKNSLEKYDDVLNQQAFRAEMISEALRDWDIVPATLSAIVGRGNLLPGMKGGGYLVEENMVTALREGKASPHASNLGALLAYSIARPLGIPAYIYDSVTADEYDEIAKITGIPGVERESMCHVLNVKAVSREFAMRMGKQYEDLNLIVVHMGGGITVSIHHKGRIIDSIRDDSGPFSPERAGSIPLLYVIDMCYSGQYTKKEMIRFIRGGGGLKSYLGTSDCREIEKMIEGGNEQAKKLYVAQAYQIAKGIGEMAPVLNGDIDYIVLTGGIAYSDMMTGMVEDRVKFIAPVERMPGENEMEALAFGAIRLLNGEKYHIYGKEDS
ncbi:putative butyrate kinase [Clostridia bacterium]|nr:putative butyrate kinase [Clostridia bacterium]